MSQVPDRSSLRVSDAERERVVNTLRTHAGEGRLEPDELEERVAGALRARTAGELDALTADLPGRSRSSSRARREGLGRRLFNEHVRAYVAVNGLLIAIWAVTGFGYFWPIWPLLGWGFALVAHGGCAPRRSSRRQRSLAAP